MVKSSVFDLGKNFKTPDNWNTSSLSKLGNFRKGKGIAKTVAQSGKIPCVRYGELYTNHHNVVRQFKSFISSKVAKDSIRLNYGDQLFAGSGEKKEEIGKSAAFIDTFEAYAGGDIVIFSTNKIDPIFLGYALNTEMVRKQKEKFAQGDSVVHIYSSSLGKIELLYPTEKKEQLAISEALSDVDALISSLEKLIKKRRKVFFTCLKNYVQPYLEYENFDDNWRIDKFKNIAHLNKIRYQTLNNTLARYCVDLDNIEQGLGRISSFADKSKTNTQRFAFQSGDILFGRLRPYLKKFWMANRDGVCSTEIWPLKAANNIDQGYLYFLIQSENFFEAANMSFGTRMPRADWKIVSDTNFVIPKEIDKQREIASILFDLENQINREQDKLSKFKKIKEGMIRELLTGRVRLI